MASSRRAEIAAYAGVGLLLLSSAGLATAGPEMVAAVTWRENAGEPAPAWLLGPFGDGVGLTGPAFYALLWVAMLGYSAVVIGARHLRPQTIAGLGGVLLALFVLAPPLLSQDVFSYIAYARLGAEAGLDPYQYAPIAIADDPVFALVGWPDTVSVYGPVFTLASYAVAPLSLAASTWAFKLLAACAVGLTAWLCARVAAWRGGDGSTAVALVVFNPLVLVHVVGAGHNDALIGLAVAATIALLLSAREVGAGTAVVLGAAVKVSALFIAPFALLGAVRPQRFLAGALVSAAIVALGAIVFFGPSALEAIGVLDANQSAMSRYSLPAVASRLLSISDEVVRTVFLAGFAVAVAGLGYWTWRGADWVRTAGWAGLAMLVASGWLLPWYVIWILPAVALSRDRVLIGATLAFTAFQLINRVPM